MWARSRGTNHFQPVGDLNLHFAGHGNAQDYQRGLDMSQGIAFVEYSVDGVNYRREVFASLRYQVMVVRLTCDSPGKLTTEIKLSRIDDDECELNPWAKRTTPGILRQLCGRC